MPPGRIDLNETAAAAAPRWQSIPLFQIFLFLQVLDLLTTIIVLQRGGYEANPVVRQFFSAGTLEGLVLSKLLVVGIAAAVVFWQRYRVLFLSNYVYAAVVCWNLLAVVLSAS